MYAESIPLSILFSGISTPNSGFGAPGAPAYTKLKPQLLWRVLVYTEAAGARTELVCTEAAAGAWAEYTLELLGRVPSVLQCHIP